MTYNVQTCFILYKTFNLKDWNIYPTTIYTCTECMLHKHDNKRLIAQILTLRYFLQW